jgi:hypothetical protein
MEVVETSYVAVRAHRSRETDGWWAEAARLAPVPPPIAALLAGRTRIELSGREAEAVLAWAATLAGWTDADPKPLRVYRHVLAR